MDGKKRHEGTEAPRRAGINSGIPMDRDKLRGGVACRRRGDEMVRQGAPYVKGGSVGVLGGAW
jgi:hypothetical protein